MRLSVEDDASNVVLDPDAARAQSEACQEAGPGEGRTADRAHASRLVEGPARGKPALPRDAYSTSNVRSLVKKELVGIPIASSAIVMSLVSIRKFAGYCEVSISLPMS